MDTRISNMISMDTRIYNMVSMDTRISNSGKNGFQNI